MLDQLFYIFSAVLLGFVIGALVMYFITGSSKGSEQTIANLEKELANYQKDVVEHFEQTADLVDGMTQSYKKVFDHLGKSARKLMTEEQIQQQIELRKGNKVTLEYLTETADDLDKQADSIHELLDESEGAKNVLDSSSEKKDEMASEVDDSNDIIETESSDDEELIVSDNPKHQNTLEDIDIEVDDEADLENEVKIREKNIYS